MALTINKENYETLLASEQPVIIDFWAEWCGPCRAIAPIIEDLAEEFEGKLIIGKCDVEENDEIASKYAIRNIPTIIMLKGGEIVEKHVGAATRDTLKQKFEALL